VKWEIAGVGRLFADMEDLLIAGQVYSLWGALALIFVFILLFLRSLPAAALCMIPNLSPVFLIFVIMGSTGIWLDMATAMIASVAIGIAVDDTLHVYHGFQQRMKRGASPVLALLRTYHGAGRAVVTTTVILSAQFMILTASDFIPTRNFGLLTTAGLIAALLFDLLLLPALLIIFHGPNSPVARWLSSRKRPRKAESAAHLGGHDPGLDASYWTVEKRCALVKEIMSGKISLRRAAQQYGLPETEVDKWLAAAQRGIRDALNNDPSRSLPGSDDKLRALVKACRRLQAENRALKARKQD
jgi:transposase-like protein